MSDSILIILAVAFIFIFLLYMSIYWYKRYLREHEQLELLKRMNSEKKPLLVSAKILEAPFEEWLNRFGYEGLTGNVYVPILFDPATGKSSPAEIGHRIIAEVSYFLSDTDFRQYYDGLWTDLQIPKFKFVDGVCGQIELLGVPYSFHAMKKKTK